MPIDIAGCSCMMHMACWMMQDACLCNMVLFGMSHAAYVESTTCDQLTNCPMDHVISWPSVHLTKWPIDLLTTCPLDQVDQGTTWPLDHALDHLTSHMPFHQPHDHSPATGPFTTKVWFLPPRGALCCIYIYIYTLQRERERERQGKKDKPECWKCPCIIYVSCM